MTLSGADEQRPVFLTAEWRSLALLNFVIGPAALGPLVPMGTELDLFDGQALVSLVGFLFQKTRVRGIAVPFHQDFEEINLRFYVKRDVHGQLRRGVVFVKEVVPKSAIAWVARTLYGENYIALPMRHDVAPGGHAEYACQMNGRWNAFRVSVEGKPSALAAGSLEHFILEHYWGYARQRDGGTMEYQVEHPAWRTWQVKSATMEFDAAALYGDRFASALSAPIQSAVLAEGSPVTVRGGARLPNRNGGL